VQGAQQIPIVMSSVVSTIGDMTGAPRRLMQRHGTTVFRYCREALRDRALAEDVQQQREPGTAPSTTIDRNVILYLAARSVGTARRALEEECATIERELRLAGRHDFDFRSRWAVTIDEVMHHLNELQPNIVHFSGQESNHRLHLNASAGIRLQDEHCQPRHVSASALSRMIGSAAPSTRLVVLNACFSKGVAKSLCKVTDCVVGTRSAIDDEATRSFAVGFYRALGYGRSVGNAMAQAIATLAAKEFPDEQFPFTSLGMVSVLIKLSYRDNAHPPGGMHTNM
jgi:hypothetical protein